MEFIRNPWVIGTIVFFVVRFSFGSIFDLSPECRDGWDSPSIGRPGACSHHGGVDRSASSLAFIVSVIIATFVGLVVHFRAESHSQFKNYLHGFSDNRERPRQHLSEKAEEIIIQTTEPLSESKIQELEEISKIRAEESANHISEQLAECAKRREKRSKKKHN